MQVAWEDYLPKRIRYYASSMDTKQLGKGKNNYDELKTHYVIFICMFDFFNLDRPIYSFENYDIENKITESLEKQKNITKDIDTYNSDILKREDTGVRDVQAMRDKAFGDYHEPVKVSEEKIEPKTTFYEETETVTITNPDEHERKVKTIDELLEDTSDIIVDIDKDLDKLKAKATIKHPTVNIIYLLN